MAKMRTQINPKKVTLVRPPYSNVYGIYKNIPASREVRPPLGLLYLASALENNGCSVTIIDGEPELLSTEEIVKGIKLSEPDIVGITSTTPEFHIAKETVEGIKKHNPNIITIAGGAHVSALPEESLKDCPDIDYIVVGEGEESIVKIVNEQPKERIISSPLIQNLDELSPPARYLVNYDHYSYPVSYKGLVKMDAIESSRGCPFHCTFCFHFHGNKVRFRDPIKVVNEIEKSYRETGSELFMFFDDTFTLKRDRVITILDEIINRGLKLEFYCFTRVDTLDEELLRKMKKAGFVKITMGIESGNQTILDGLKKGTKLEDYERIYNSMAALGLETRGSFMIGCPYETRQTIADSINFAKKLPLYRIGVNILTPYPGSEIYNSALKGEGIRLVCKDWKEFKRWGTSVVETDELSKEDIEYYQKKFLREFNSSPKVLFYHLKQLLKGDLSYYYYRPIIYAVKQRIRYKFIEFLKPHRFMPPERPERQSSMPTISVIMSVLNEERREGLLREAIESILNQTFTDFEFIIVNDGSTDSSLEIIQSYNDERIRIINNKKNIGLTRSLNIAIEQARGELIARQDADDVSLPNRFEEQIGYLEEHPEVALLGTSVYRIDEQGKVSGKIIVSANPSKSLFKRNQLSHGSIMFRKAVIDRLEGYNELFRYGQDYELWLRIAKHYQVRNLKQILYKLRFDRESTGATKGEESVLSHLLAIRLAVGEPDEAILEAIRDKGLSSIYSYLNKSERAYFHKEMAGRYMTIDDVAAARRQYKQAFMLNPFDVYNDANLIISHVGKRAWSGAHRIYEFIKYELS